MAAADAVGSATLLVPGQLPDIMPAALLDMCRYGCCPQAGRPTAPELCSRGGVCPSPLAVCARHQQQKQKQ